MAALVLGLFILLTVAVGVALGRVREDQRYLESLRREALRAERRGETR